MEERPLVSRRTNDRKTANAAKTAKAAKAAKWPPDDMWQCWQPWQPSKKPAELLGHLAAHEIGAKFDEDLRSIGRASRRPEPTWDARGGTERER